MSAEFDDAIGAVRKLFEAKGDGYEFTADEIWPYLEKPEKIATNAKGSMSRGLTAQGYIKSTQRHKIASSENRKSNSSPAYTFGDKISADSYRVFLRNTGQANTARNKDADADLTGVYPLEFPLQRILHGCPGSGKSYRLHEDSADAHFVIRTVFHPETRYSDFVGSLRPESIYRISEDAPEFKGSEQEVPGEPYVQYTLQPGPLLRAYQLACMHPDRSVVLIIEEISRAVAAHVFGDMLQLLDRRDEDGDPEKGYSEYEIQPRSEIRSWLILNSVSNDGTAVGEMRFPPNLYIWATMNRSDQNARQLDSAFLRRWSKTYLSYRQTGTYDHETVIYGGTTVTWGELRSTLNDRLKSSEGVPEDKFIGPYFLSRRQLTDPDAIYEDLWGYIWNDVLKSRAPAFFGGVATFAELHESWAGGSGRPIGEVASPASAEGE